MLEVSEYTSGLALGKEPEKQRCWLRRWCTRRKGHLFEQKGGVWISGMFPQGPSPEEARPGRDREGRRTRGSGQAAAKWPLRCSVGDRGCKAPAEGEAVLPPPGSQTLKCQGRVGKGQGIKQRKGQVRSWLPTGFGPEPHARGAGGTTAHPFPSASPPGCRDSGGSLTRSHVGAAHPGGRGDPRTGVGGRERLSRGGRGDPCCGSRRGADVGRGLTLRQRRRRQRAGRG